MGYFKHFAMGWVVGYTVERIGVMGCAHYYLEQTDKDGAVRPILYPTKEAALCVVREKDKEVVACPDNPDMRVKFFTRLWMYSTPSIDNARKLCLIRDSVGEPVPIDTKDPRLTTYSES